MKFIVDYAALRHALQFCSSVIEKRQTIAILANVLIEARPESVVLVGTDLEVTCVTELPAIVAATGSCTVEAAALYDIAKNTNEALSIEFDEARGRLAVSAGTASYTLMTIPADAFPLVPNTEDGDALEFSASDFLPMLRTVSYAAASENERGFALTGAQFRATNTAFTLAATDGRRLASASLSGRFGREHVGIIPNKLVKSAERLNVAAGVGGSTVHFSWNDNHVAVRLGGVTLLARRDDASIPDFSATVSRADEYEIVSRIGTAAFARAVRNVLPFTPPHVRRCMFEIGDTYLRLSAKTAARGECADSVEAAGHGGLTRFQPVNLQYFADMLDAIGTEAVDVKFGSATRATIARPVDSSQPFTALHVLTNLEDEK